MPTMVMRIINHDPDLSALPESLRQLVSACLAKDPNARPTPGQILDYVGDVPAGTTWLPPAVMSGVQEQVAKVNQALATSVDETADHERTQQGMSTGGTALLGGAAGAAAAHALGDDEATRVAHPGQDTSDATSVLGPSQQQSPPTAQYEQGTQNQDPYADLYGQPRPQTGPQQEQLQQEQLQRRQEQQQREDRRRRQEAERAHRERLRAERSATRRAQAQARRTGQPGLWGIIKLLPLLLLPLIQIPLGYGASLAWSWFTTETEVWTGTVYHFDPLSVDSFRQATMLGYFLFNNLLLGEYLNRSLRSSYLMGSVLALAFIAATNGMLYSLGFWA